MAGKIDWTSGSQTMPLAWLDIALVIFIPIFDLMFQWKIIVRPDGTLPDLIVQSESEVKTSGKNMGRPVWDCIEIMPVGMADDLGQSKLVSGSRTKKFWERESSIGEFPAECRRQWLFILCQPFPMVGNSWLWTFKVFPNCRWHGWLKKKSIKT